jgi:glycine dehydrogenase subunit 2
MGLIFERSRRGRKGYRLPRLDVERVKPDEYLPEDYLREELNMPELDELEVVRHFTVLSQKNYAIDTTMVPLGSCSMKYNPRINEELAGMEGFLEVHPLTEEEFIQGSLRVAYELKELLKELGGFAEVSLQPAAGAQGELLGLLLIRAYHNDRGNSHKRVVLVPDSAHGTNPATASICGFDIRTVRSDANGELDWEDFKSKLRDDVACLMITNPNTLGIFERKIKRVAQALHAQDSLLYMDGANFNAIVGVARPGLWGVDVMHFNLHKTFSSPHGGGGPGSGPVGVSERLIDFLPTPHIDYDGSRYFLRWDIPKSVGSLLAFYGHFGVWLRALAYILSYGKEINRVAEISVLNARYLRKLLKGLFKDVYAHVPCMHEFVLSATPFVKRKVGAIDVAKRLLDYGFYAPTVNFPLIVREALMIEPTETENLTTLGEFAEALRSIVGEVRENPELVKTAPHRTPVKRIREAEANRKPILRASIDGDQPL